MTIDQIGAILVLTQFAAPVIIVSVMK